MSASVTNIGKHPRQILSRAELDRLTRRSDAVGWWAIVSTWAVIVGTFAALARWPHPVTFVAAVVVLGGRQLGLAILMHEAAHRTLFKTRFLNDVVTDWLCARPIFNYVALYRGHHLGHHKFTGTERDPDLALAPTKPMRRASLARKYARDLIGLTGIKRLFGQALMAFEVLEYTVTPDPKRRPRNGRRTMDYLRAGARNSAGFVLTNSALALGLFAAGHLWVFWAWVVAYLTTFSAFVRTRSMAEHALTERGPDPFRNTRTTRAGILARMTVAPIHVNFHLEHHLLVAVPWHRLPELHRLLRERGAIAQAPGYADVLRTVSAG